MIKQYKRAAIVVTMLLTLLQGAGSATGFPSIPRPSGQSPNQSGIVPDGTILTLRMGTHLSSSSSNVGDTFTATVTEAVTVDNRIAIPAGSKVEGHVTSVERARRRSRSGMIAVGFDRLILDDGRSYRIYGELTALDPDERQRIEDESRISGGSTKKRSVVFIGGGAGVGAVIGAITGGGKGAAVGSGVGAALGVAGVLLTKGNEAEVEIGTEFGLELVKQLDLSVARTGGRTVKYSSTEALKQAQRILGERGYYTGDIDGVYGPRTHRAIRDFQLDHNLPVTAQLDEPTARALGMTSPSRVKPSPKSHPVKVISAFAERLPDESVRVVIETEVPSGGWHLYEDHTFINDELHVWARGTPPTGLATQVVTHNKVEAKVAQAPTSLTRVVVHGASRELSVDVLTPRDSRVRLARAVRRQIRNLVAQYEQGLQVQTSRTQLLFDSHRSYTEREVELLLALRSLEEVAHLYSQVIESVPGPMAQRGAARSLLSQASQVHRTIQQLPEHQAPDLSNNWTALRETLKQVAVSQGLDWDLARR